MHDTESFLPISFLMKTCLAVYFLPQEHQVNKVRRSRTFTTHLHIKHSNLSIYIFLYCTHCTHTLGPPVLLTHSSITCMYNSQLCDGHSFSILHHKRLWATYTQSLLQDGQVCQVSKWPTTCTHSPTLHT